MAETNINIYLHDGESSNPTSPKDPGTTPQPDDPTQNKGEQGKGNKNMALMLGAYIGKQAINFATARVGQATHSSLMQQKVNSASKVVAYGAMIAVNPVMGVAALGVDLISSSIDFAHKANNERTSMIIVGERAGNVNRSR